MSYKWHVFSVVYTLIWEHLSIFLDVSFRVTSNPEFQDYDNHSWIDLRGHRPGARHFRKWGHAHKILWLRVIGQTSKIINELSNVFWLMSLHVSVIPFLLKKFSKKCRCGQNSLLKQRKVALMWYRPMYSGMFMSLSRAR